MNPSQPDTKEDVKQQNAPNELNLMTYDLMLYGCLWIQRLLYIVIYNDAPIQSESALLQVSSCEGQDGTLQIQFIVFDSQQHINYLTTIHNL